MGRRFSAEELYEIRNSIPINDLIRELMIPSKVSEGFFRFLCPLCNEGQTATNPKTNLARCFRCEKNFNTIDMYMICRKSGFVESVRELKKLRKNYDRPNVINRNPSESKEQREPDAIGKILNHLIRHQV